MSEKIKHLEIIQSTINRMSQNSFLIKGWTLTLSTAIIAYTLTLESKKLDLLPIIVVVMFWMLDAYYLMKERLYRRLYDIIRTSEKDYQFTMKLEEDESVKDNIFKCIFSITLILFYLGISLSYVALTLVQT